MSVQETLKKRKSIRSYTGEKISDQDLKTILDAVQYSPVAMGKYDSIQITVINDPEILDEIDKNCAITMGVLNKRTLYDAPTLILISSTLPDNMSSNILAYSNCAVIAENIVLQAVELGIATCHIWGAVMALAKKPKLIEKVKIEKGFYPICGVLVGKSDEQYKEKVLEKDRIKVTCI